MTRPRTYAGRPKPPPVGTPAGDAWAKAVANPDGRPRAVVAVPVPVVAGRPCASAPLAATDPALRPWMDAGWFAFVPPNGRYRVAGWSCEAILEYPGPAWPDAAPAWPDLPALIRATARARTFTIMGAV